MYVFSFPAVRYLISLEVLKRMIDGIHDLGELDNKRFDDGGWWMVDGGLVHRAIST